MAYDQVLANRINQKLARQRGLKSKEMFGGICFLIDGNMCCGVIKDEMVIRADPNEADEVLSNSNAREFDFSGRAMKGWYYISSNGLKSEKDLAYWVGMSLKYVKSLPKKKK